MKKHAESHMDHGFTSEQWDYIFARYADKTAFFIDTFELPEHLGSVTNELYGPSAGDAPVLESEVVYGKRGDRAWDSRLVLKPKRPTRFVRVIAGPHEEKCERCNGTGFLPSSPFSWYAHGPHQVGCMAEGCDKGIVKHACILYTSYGVPSIDAPQSPKEPGDLEAQLKDAEAALFNVLEDIRIEHKIVETYPGAKDVLAHLNSKIPGFHNKHLEDAQVLIDRLTTQLAEAQAFWDQHGLAAPLSMMPCSDCGAPRMGDAVYDPPVPDTDGRCQTCGML